MESKMSVKKKTLLKALACVLAVLLAVTGIWGIKMLSAKYKQNFTFNGSVYVETNDDSEVVLYEHEAYLQADGTYLLATAAKEVQANSYQMLPGVDIPKDPCVYVTALYDESYIFLEVCDELTNERVTWTLESCWVLVDGVTGQNGGAVYVYAADGANPTLVSTLSDEELTSVAYTATDATTTPENTTEDQGYALVINIIANQTITVSSKLPSGYDSGSLAFYGYVAQASEGADPAEVFGTFFSSSDTTTTTTTTTTTEAETD